MRDFHRWLIDWDWRPLARLTAWALIAAHFGYLSKAGLAHAARELVLYGLLSFGVLTYLLALALASCVRAYLTLDEWTYWLAESLMSPWAGRAPFAVNFLAAFAAQVGLVWTLAAAWRWLRPWLATAGI